MEKIITKASLVKSKLETLKVGDSFSVISFIKKHWGEHHYFNNRSFDVFLCTAKRKIYQDDLDNGKVERKFLVKKGILTRIA
jgi:hypothetical protein